MANFFTDDQLKDAFQQLNATLITAVNADTVIDALLADGVLCRADYAELTEIKERRTKTRRMMALLYGTHHPNAFVLLRKALDDEPALSWLVQKVDETARTVAADSTVPDDDDCDDDDDKGSAGAASAHRISGCQQSCETYFDVSSVVGTIQDNKSPIVGLAILNDLLFVISSPPDEQAIAVYSTKNFLLKRRIRVDELSDHVTGLAACGDYSCLYVSDRGFRSIHKVNLSGKDGVVSWPVAGDPRGLSVKNDNNILVVCSNYRKRPTLLKRIKKTLVNTQSPTNVADHSDESETSDGEYDVKPEEQAVVELKPTGHLFRAVLLPPEISNPTHAVQLPDSNRLLLCHGEDRGDVHGVCVIEYPKTWIAKAARGYVLHHVSCGREPGDALGHFDGPLQLAVDRKGFVSVADSSNDRIVLLDSSSNWIGVSTASSDDRLHRPSSLCLDVIRNRLYVGEMNAPYRVLVFEL